MSEPSSEDSDKESDDLLRESSNHLTPEQRSVYLREIIPYDAESRSLPLKELQSELKCLHDEYCQEIYDLEVKYHDDFQHFYEMREKIINGKTEPLAEIRQWKPKKEEINLTEFSEFFEESYNLPEYYNGIPNFWLHILRTSDTIAQLIFEPDLPALQYLKNIAISYDDDSFTLEFTFRRNPYFFNNVLTKQYFLKKTLDVNNPLDYEGSKIYSSKGCVIFWRDQMNLAISFIYKQNGRIQIIPKDSFFNFFDPPIVEMSRIEDLDDEIREALNLDFKVGNFFREEIIPKALLYFIGDKIDEEANFDETAIDDEDDVDFIPETMESKHIANVANLLSSIIKN